MMGIFDIFFHVVGVVTTMLVVGVVVAVAVGFMRIERRHDDDSK